MNTRSILLALASVALLAACAPPPPPAPAAPAPAPDTSAADAAAVRDLTDRFVVAWNAGDAAAYGAMIADDVVHMPQGAAANVGRDAVLAAMAGQFDLTTVQQSATIDEVVVMGDYANAYGTWRVDPVSAAGEAAEVTAGRWMVLYRRNAAGGWQFWRWMWNQTSGPAAPAA